MFGDIPLDPSALLPFILIGFAAQMIDGALGMAFGQISSTLLVILGVPPAAASAGVHTAETFTTAVSGVSHIAHHNVEGRKDTNQGAVVEVPQTNLVANGYGPLR